MPEALNPNREAGVPGGPVGRDSSAEASFLPYRLVSRGGGLIEHSGTRIIAKHVSNKNKNSNNTHAPIPLHADRNGNPHISSHSTNTKSIIRNRETHQGVREIFRLVSQS